jgi:hypothetical protein
VNGTESGASYRTVGIVSARSKGAYPSGSAYTNKQGKPKGQCGAGMLVCGQPGPLADGSVLAETKRGCLSNNAIT